MKFIKLCLLVFPFIISCSTSNDLEDPTVSVASTYQRDEDLAANILNPYDYVGKIHNEVVQQYSAGSNFSTSITDITSEVFDLCTSSNSFSAISPVDYQIASEGQIAYIVNNPMTSKAESISSSLQGAKSKLSQMNFVDSLIALCNSDATYSAINRFIAVYEVNILADTEINTADQKTILISTSIARYSIYEKKKRPKKNTDPDWAMMVGNIWAGMDGSNDGEQDAIMKSAAVYVFQNN